MPRADGLNGLSCSRDWRNLDDGSNRPERIQIVAPGCRNPCRAPNSAFRVQTKGEEPSWDHSPGSLAPCQSSMLTSLQTVSGTHPI